MNREKGFTLIEVIISIAVLSIISVIFLQLFVKAGDVDDAAYQQDQSVMISNTAFEQIKSCGEMSIITELRYFDSFAMTEDMGKINFTKRFDKKMEPVDSKLSADEGTIQIVILIEPIELIEDGSVGLYKVTSTVMNLEEAKEIYSNSTKVVLKP